MAVHDLRNTLFPDYLLTGRNTPCSGLPGVIHFQRLISVRDLPDFHGAIGGVWFFSRHRGKGYARNSSFLPFIRGRNNSRRWLGCCSRGKGQQQRSAKGRNKGLHRLGSFIFCATPNGFHLPDESPLARPVQPRKNKSSQNWINGRAMIILFRASQQTTRVPTPIGYGSRRKLSADRATSN